MKIDPNALSSVFSTNTAPAQAGALEKLQTDATTAPATEKIEATDDIEKIRSAVKQLMETSAIRPEAVAGRSSDDPVKAFDEGTLKNFVSALLSES